MKEKTFKELIEEKSPDIQFNDKHDWDLPRFSGNDMVYFGQQVREATINECLDCAEYESDFKRIDSLPKDKIRIDENT